ncbi:(2Fe-2S)-binding protein [Dyella sp. A6]|uniref:(2Fe-2S)-binding protein n=1 Tax=Dyella aluminiiresistens TaxID=3069105 RepID=UPI002E777C36|nr:(2Fe-2S)-binding protein [Dyella sp. A6]
MKPVVLYVNGQPLQVAAGISVAAAVAHMQLALRRSCSGQPRAPLCGMGICFECRVSIDGVAQQRSCQVLVRDGMQVRTDV